MSADEYLDEAVEKFSLAQANIALAEKPDVTEAQRRKYQAEARVAVRIGIKSAGIALIKLEGIEK